MKGKKRIKHSIFSSATAISVKGRLALSAYLILMGTLPVLFMDCSEFVPMNGSVFSSEGVRSAFSKPFQSPSTCKECHPVHFKEWEGSVMHYAAASPVFDALELVIRENVSQQGGAVNSTQFCVGCHAPTASPPRSGESPVPLNSLQPASSFLSEVDQEGVSCHYCHSVRGAHEELLPSEGMLGDGIANLGHNVEVKPAIVGPYSPAEMESSREHLYEKSEYLTDSKFCGSCHDVRIPAPDAKTGEPFMRLENLYTEFLEEYTPRAIAAGGEAFSCQDCHMSLYPVRAPGTYPQDEIAAGTGIVRKHALHAFTAVSTPLIDTEQFPNLTSTEFDKYGFPVGQAERREQMLQAAVELRNNPATIVQTVAGVRTFNLRVDVENKGAGHRVPSGFSQERETWIEVTVTDDNGATVYQSGYLRGAAFDDTLDNKRVVLDPKTLEVATIEDGPDKDQRSEGVNLGLKSFRNHFVRVLPDGTEEEVFSAHLANHMDNSRSLPPLETVTVPYDIPVDPNIVGNLNVRIKLRYRAFPPYFLRALREAEVLRSAISGTPPGITEQVIQKNTPVDMAEINFVVPIQ